MKDEIIKMIKLMEKLYEEKLDKFNEIKIEMHKNRTCL